MKVLYKSGFAFVLVSWLIFIGCSPRPRFTDNPAYVSNARGSFRVGQIWTGVASYYGSEFHGRRTACGETFDMNAITAAHRELPFGSILKVENLDNGRVVKVRVNDRGPQKRKRILDLSFGAARELDMVSEGVANVKIELVSVGDQ